MAMKMFNEMSMMSKLAYAGGVLGCLLAGPIAYISAEGDHFCFVRPLSDWNRFPRGLTIPLDFFITPALAALFVLRAFVLGRQLQLPMWISSYVVGGINVFMGFALMISLCQAFHGMPVCAYWTAALFKILGGAAMGFAGVNAQLWDTEDSAEKHLFRDTYYQDVDSDDELARMRV